MKSELTIVFISSYVGLVLSVGAVELWVERSSPNAGPSLS